MNAQSQPEHVIQETSKLKLRAAFLVSDSHRCGASQEDDLRLTGTKGIVALLFGLFPFSVNFDPFKDVKRRSLYSHHKQL